MAELVCDSKFKIHPFARTAGQTLPGLFLKNKYNTCSTFL